MSTTVWQSQPSDAPRISLEFVRHQAENLNARWRREKRLVYASAAVAALAAVAASLLPMPVVQPEQFTWAIRFGSVLAVIGIAYLCLEVRRRGGLIAKDEHGDVMQTLGAYRSELQRRRDYHLSAWRWSVWPIAPAAVVLIAGTVLFDQRPGKWLRLAAAAAVMILCLGLGAWHQNRVGCRYQRELDALASLDKG